jgi:CBS domain containing-hemolysin-like protein
VEGGRLEPSAIDAKPLVVHETMPVLKLIEAMRETGAPMAIVNDEFGAVEGVVTASDVLEAILGHLGTGDAPITEEGGALIADGGADLRRIERSLGVDLSGEADEAATLAGFLLHRLGRMPQPGETVRAENLRFEVVDADARRIRAVRIVREEAEAAE